MSIQLTLDGIHEGRKGTYVNLDTGAMRIVIEAKGERRQRTTTLDAVLSSAEIRDAAIAGIIVAAQNRLRSVLTYQLAGGTGAKAQIVQDLKDIPEL